MKPFLLLQTRTEDTAADNEYESFMKFSGLDPGQLKRLRAETGKVPKLVLGSYSGIILGGGPYNVSDPENKKSSDQKRCETKLISLVNRIIDQDFPFLGTCYGIGIVGLQQKAIVSRKFGEPVGATTVRLTPAGLNDRILKGLAKEFEAFVGHKEATEKLPKISTLLASSITCPVQLYKIKTNIYVSQFHTELDADGLALRIQIYKNYGYFPPETSDELIAEVRKHQVTEPVKILRNFVKIYGGDSG